MADDTGSPLASASQLTEVLTAAEPLTFEERRRIVRQAQILIEQLFVHLPLKRAMHAVDPLQRLRLLDRRLDLIATAAQALAERPRRMLTADVTPQPHGADLRGFFDGELTACRKLALGGSP